MDVAPTRGTTPSQYEVGNGIDYQRLQLDINYRF
jgi:hypothetical protein